MTALFGLDDDDDDILTNALIEHAGEAANDLRPWGLCSARTSFSCINYCVSFRHL